jgi:hypothetical protein
MTESAANPGFPRLDIPAWIDGYSEGQPVGRDEIFVALAATLSPILPGFRWFKSTRQFRQDFPGGRAYLCLERPKQIVVVEFGVTLDAVAAREDRLFDLGITRGRPRPVTMMKNSLNIAPHSRTWPHPTWAAWPISGSEGLRRGGAELSDFVCQIVLPYLHEHKDPAIVRQTLLSKPRRSDRFGEASLFAIDHLLRRRDWLDADYESHAQRTVQPEYRERLRTWYDRTVACWDDPV